jgi:hypothetical protein
MAWYFVEHIPIPGRQAAGAGFDLLLWTVVTSSFLFSGLQRRRGANIFSGMRAERVFRRLSGCYICFSGFSTSRVIFAQD